MTGVAVVTIAHGRHDHLEAQHESLARGSRRPDVYVVVAMDDPASSRTRWGLRRDVVASRAHPLGLPLAAARNRGVAHALERGADVVVLLDVDCLAGHDLVAAYAAAVARHRTTVWSGPVTYLSRACPAATRSTGSTCSTIPIPPARTPGRSRVLPAPDPDLFWSLSFALSRPAWHQIGGFCEDYVGYGGEDTDFGPIRRAGLDHGWHGDARAYHQWHPSRPPGGASRRHPAQCRDLPPPLGPVADAGLARAFEERGLVVERDGRWVRSSRPA